MKPFLGSLILSLVLLFSIVVFAGGAAAGDESGLYKAKCAFCHGAVGEGSAKIAKMFKLEGAKLQLRGEATKKASDADLLKVLLGGRGKMPGFKCKISDDEAKKLIQYLRTFKK